MNANIIDTKLVSWSVYLTVIEGDKGHTWYKILLHSIPLRLPSSLVGHLNLNVSQPSLQALQTPITSTTHTITTTKAETHQ